MIGFREFIKGSLNETEHHVIDVDLKSGQVAQFEKVNQDLDAVTENPYINSAMFVNSVRGTLERYGILLPAHSNMQQLSLEGEYVYALGDSGYFVYMVHNLNPEGNVEAWAQIVNQDELNDLGTLDADENDVDEPKDTSQQPTEWMRYPKARRDDDSGDTAEYA
jgi:hypothetical protein